MLEPGSIAHLIFRNTVAESLEAVAAGQASYAVVPCYNSITQWDGATMKALASGAFEIFGQVCMPTSYVLVAHKEYMSEFLSTYESVKDPGRELTDEEKAKIYTRFLTRIYVGAQADEQYRGRLLRPDMTHAQVEISRNPLRVLEGITRSDLIKQMTKATNRPQQSLPGNMSGGSIMVQSQTQVVVDTLEAPAALVAAGLLDAPGDPEGWDQPGSLGEIVSLLRNLLMLLNVYSFGSPDLPENKTSYLLVGRRGAGAPPATALRSPAAAPTRIMTMIRPANRKSSADIWMRPRADLARTARDFGFVFDRPPVMISPGNSRVFLLEGGRPKDGFSASPIGWLEYILTLRWVFDLFAPPQDPKGQPAGVKPKDKSLRKALEKKREGSDLRDDSPSKYDTFFLGQYPTWCHGFADDSCWCCDEAHGDTVADSGTSWIPLLRALLLSAVGVTALALAFLFVYCPLTGQCRFWDTGSLQDPRLLPAPVTQPADPYPGTPYPGSSPQQPQPSGNSNPSGQGGSYPGYHGMDGGSDTKPTPSQPVTKAPGITQAPSAPAPRLMPAFHVAFFEGKSNLTSEAMNALASAASQALQLDHPATLKVVALGPRESDNALWQRRLQAVKDELVRMNVPANRITIEGNGPFVLKIAPNRPAPAATGKRASLELDTVADPMSGD
jgi:outer membrane protein OmpA-like peptidoglycan-associated protein